MKTYITLMMVMIVSITIGVALSPAEFKKPTEQFTTLEHEGHTYTAVIVNKSLSGIAHDPACICNDWMRSLDYE